MTDYMYDNKLFIWEEKLKKAGFKPDRLNYWEDVIYPVPLNKQLPKKDPYVSPLSGKIVIK